MNDDLAKLQRVEKQRNTFAIQSIRSAAALKSLKETIQKRLPKGQAEAILKEALSKAAEQRENILIKFEDISPGIAAQISDELDKLFPDG
jgi:hypothetical protein